MHVVVAGVLVADGRVLLGHRRASRRWYPDVWDLPGGHVESGETGVAALVRELREELGVRVAQRDCTPLVDLQDGGDDEGGMRLTGFRVARWRGRPVNACPEEHDELGWFTAADLPGRRLAHPGYLDLLGKTLAGEPPDAPVGQPGVGRA